tara:strand:+ start:3124 stop:3963 length:840 start_codon:yes stop_codon:yes gene_type:complete
MNKFKNKLKLIIYYVLGKIYFKFFYKKKITTKKFLFTIGAPRSGTSMLGNILNQHPNILLSHENRTLQKILENNFSFRNAVQSCVEQSILEHENIKKIKFRNFQSRWIKNTNYKKVEKEKIEVIGDKKSGGNAILYKKFSDNFENLIKKNNKILFLAIIRNPYNAAKSYLKSHPHEVKNLNEAVDKILERNFYALKLKKKFSDRVKIIHYENFLNNPKENMINICRFLEIKVSEKWLNFINLNYQKKNTSYKANCSSKELTYIKNKIDPDYINYYNKYF